MEKNVNRSQMDLLLDPSSIAIVGASATREWATGNQVIRNLRESEYAGRIEVVSPSGAEIEGIQSVAAIAELTEIDAVVIAVGPRGVLAALGEAHEAGVPAAIVMSVGLDADALAAVAEFSRTTGMLVHGPNCMGHINVTAGTMIWADEGILTGLPSGNVSLISQSGSGAIFVARSMQGVGFAHILSTGNEAATTTADYLRVLAEDTVTDAIGIIVESIGDAKAFAAAADLAHQRGKAVVALKVGRSSAGAAATVAHTGAVLADDAIVTALFERVGIPLVSDYDELASALELLALTKGRAFGDGRTAVLTISGGQSALAADLAEPRGTTLAAFSPETTAELRNVLPGVHPNNPLDTGGSIAAGEDYFVASLRAVAADAGVDVIVAIVDSQSTLSDTEIEYEDELVEAMWEAAETSTKPFVIASSSSLTIHPARVPATGSVVPVIRGIGNAFQAIGAAVTALRPTAAPGERPLDLPGPAAIAGFAQELSSVRGPISHECGQRLLAAYGLPFVRSGIAVSPEHALELAGEVGFPLVLKVASADIAHRSDIGAVVTGITDAAALREAWARIEAAVREHRPDAHIDGMELQQEVGESIEAFVGAVSDERLGATVGMGLGGVWVELLKDAAHGLAPLSAVTATALLQRTKLHELLSGYRNLHPNTDPAPLVDVVVRLSWLMADLEEYVAECDFNPVLVEAGSGRAVLIDALLVSRGSND